MSKKAISCFLLAIAFGQVHAASFDCKLAKSTVEKAICSDPALSKLDEELSAAYKAALSKHPVPSYVKVRQREWNKDNKFCDAKAITSCLKSNYSKRVSELSSYDSIKVYASNKNFSYTDGDAVVEFRQAGGKNLISVWGGANIHKLASEDAGKAVYTVCEFDGEVKNSGKAVSKSGDVLNYKISGDILSIPDQADTICSGFASLPEQMQLVR